MTIRVAPPGRWERFCQGRVLPFLERINKGSLHLVLPNGESRTYGHPDQGRACFMRIRDYAFFRRVVRDGDIGFGESYMAGEWDTDDLTGLLALLIENRHVFDEQGRTAWIGRLANRLFHLRRSNTLHGSRKNIRDHYDLSNDFFALFLDPTMMYSSGIFRSEKESLEQSQYNKLHALIDRARIGPGHHVLEIGTGWGGFAIEAVRRTGCRVTTATISQEQFDFARERIRQAGLEDRIEVKLCDYRLLEGSFDRIVSIEMLEAVGHEHLGAFFAACDRLLKPDGLAAIQVITIPDQRYDAYRTTTDWIQKHIFPGGNLPSLTALSAAMTNTSTFFVEHLDNIGIHYARTLREWRYRFVNALPQVKALGFDDVFVRKWLYYFAYCEAGFQTRTINNLHLLLTRAHNSALDDAPPSAPFSAPEVHAGQGMANAGAR